MTVEEIRKRFVVAWHHPSRNGFVAGVTFGVLLQMLYTMVHDGLRFGVARFGASSAPLPATVSQTMQTSTISSQHPYFALLRKLKDEHERLPADQRANHREWALRQMNQMKATLGLRIESDPAAQSLERATLDVINH
jgi:hypothetical protein